MACPNLAVAMVDCGLGQSENAIKGIVVATTDSGAELPGHGNTRPGSSMMAVMGKGSRRRRDGGSRLEFGCGRWLLNGRKALKDGRKLSRPRRDLYSDDPVAPDGDRIGRDALVRQLSRTLVAIADHSPSSVVALVGPWGSGKTSLIGAMVATLNDQGWYVATHNPWSYSDYAGAVLGFFSSIRAAVPSTLLDSTWREDLGSWVSRIAPFGSIGQALGVDASTSLGAMGQLLAGDQSPDRLAQKARDGLSQLDHPLLVIVDDLDRLEPAELLFTFKLVRLLGRLPNVYYLIAYDEETLIDALKRTGLVGDDDGRARQYLEKMVQVRLEIPPLQEEQQRRLFNAGISDLLATHGITLTPDDVIRLGQMWQGCLAAYLDQPRAIKRLFTQVDAMWAEVSGEVDFVDFLAVTFLETFEAGCFDLMVRRRDELLESWTADYREQPHKDRWDRWIGALKEAGARRPSAIAGLMSEMFLVLRSARENMSYGPSWRPEVARRRGIGSEEYFDRYVQITVPEGDLPDQLVREAAGELRAGVGGPALVRLEPFWSADAAAVLSKLERIDQAEPLPVEATLRVLGVHYGVVNEQRPGLLGSANVVRVLQLARQIMNRLPLAEAHDLAIQIADMSPTHLLMMADLVRKGSRSDEAAADGEHWTGSASADIGRRLTAYLRRQTDTPVADVPLLNEYLWACRSLSGEAETQEIVWGAIEDRLWTLEDILALLVPVGVASNGRTSWPTLGDISEGAVDAILGLTRVRAVQPGSTAQSRAEVPSEPSAGEPVSWAARRAKAARALHDMRERQDRSGKDDGHQSDDSPAYSAQPDGGTSSEEPG